MVAAVGCEPCASELTFVYSQHHETNKLGVNCSLRVEKSRCICGISTLQIHFFLSFLDSFLLGVIFLYLRGDTLNIEVQEVQFDPLIAASVEYVVTDSVPRVLACRRSEEGNNVVPVTRVTLEILN